MAQKRDENAIRAPVPMWEMVLLVLLVVLSGFGLSYLLFYFTTSEINKTIARQIDPPVVKAVSRVQTQINATHEVLRAIQHVVRVTPQTGSKFFDDFMGEIDAMHVPLAGIYETHLKEGRLQTANTLYRNQAIAQPRQQLTDSLDLAAIIAPALIEKDIVSGIWHDNAAPVLEADFLFLATSCDHGDNSCVLLALLPLPTLLNGFGALLAEQILSGYSVYTLALSESVDTEDQKLIFARGVMRPGVGWLGAPPVTHDNVVFRDHAWHFNFTANPDTVSHILVFLPFITLFVGLMLTVIFVVYITDNYEYRKNTARLTHSLSRSNDELKEKIHAEEIMALALRDSEQKYRNIFENAGIGICQIDLSGAWINLNRTLAQMLGYADAQELLERQPDTQQKLFVDTNARLNFFESMGQKTRSDFETAVRRQDGNIVWVNMRGHIVYDDMLEPQYYECTMYDVTRRRLTERALIAAKEQADFANRSKSEFLANMSHELRTPLNAIIGFSEIIKNQMFGPEGAAQYIEYAKDIYDSGELLLSLINDILDMSKIEAGKRSLSETTFDVERVIQACVRLVAGRAKVGRLHLTVQVPKDLPPVRAEERALKQVLTNLMTNAIKFTPENGEVKVSAAIDTFGHLCVAVSDTGIGIAAEDIPTALAPFGQIESALSRSTQGTGLGLPLTKALVELHGGELQIESEVGKGTIVSVVLPADRVVLRTA